MSRQTIDHHLEKHIRPAWKEKLAETIEEDCARVLLMERIAWQQIEAALAGQMDETERVKEELPEGPSTPTQAQEQAKKTAKKAKRVPLNGPAGNGAMGELRAIERIVTRSRPDLKMWFEIIWKAVEFRSKVRGDFLPESDAGKHIEVKTVVPIVIQSGQQIPNGPLTVQHFAKLVKHDGHDDD